MDAADLSLLQLADSAEEALAIVRAQALPRARTRMEQPPLRPRRVLGERR